MRLNTKKLGFLVSFCAFLISQTAFCEVRLPRLISDGMVLQRDAEVKIWGWADAGEEVTVNFNGKSYTTAAGPDGKWTASLPLSKAGGPYTMEISASNHITLKDILIGDVWVCSGQSNMELMMERVKDKYPDEITNAKNNSIRQFEVPDKYNFNAPQEDLESGAWESANPETIFKFTAIGYFFAKELYQKYHVPIGLINASLGGSPAQAWMSEEALQAFPEYLQEAMQYRDDKFVNQIKQHDKAVNDAWYTLLNLTDEGLADKEKPWFDPGYDSSQWDTMNIPGYWADGPLGPVKGVVWFRKEIDVPAAMAGRPARLWLGRIVDGDQTYFNGQKVGAITYEWPPRKYDIPADLLKEGKNTIVVKVINYNSWARGGFVLDKPYHLEVAGQTIDLKGSWQYKLGAVMGPKPSETFIRWKSLGLFNGMIAPLLNYPIKGVIWYQGESNANRTPSEYNKLFSTLIADWREKWNQGGFPFLYVQLTAFMEAKDKPSESGWAELREAQLKTLSVPNTAMAVTIDIGEWNDIHPLNKKDVGKRLALAAQKVAYDEDVVYSGPIYQSMEIDGNDVILTFTHTNDGLVARGGKLKQFAIAGLDKKFVWAKAKIKGDKIIVWNDEIPNPVAVRYAWADNPEGANLYNKAGLPASPFRTDE